MLSKPPVSYAFAKANGVAVTGLDDGIAEAVMRHGAPAGALAELRRALDMPVRAQRVTAGEFDEYISALYNGAGEGAAALADDLAQDLDLSRLLQEIPRVEDLLDSQNDAPLIRLINALLSQALHEGASDIHIEPFESRSVVRLRIDGTLHDLIEPAQALHTAIVSRIKIMAQLDIAEKRLPQDGRIALRAAGKPIDVRVSTIPTGHGERVVLRLLDKQAGRLDPKALNIMTVEDPIEYDLDGINQTQTNSRIDMSFSRALRTILRQDPDVIMIGEIRDLESAEIAIQASLTGHLVITTLHTNDAVSAVTRLVDMGVEPFLLASSLIGIGAQRLVRKLCLECRQPLDRGASQLRSLGLASTSGHFHTARGCPACNRSGYKGRTGIYELLAVDDDLRKLIHDRVDEQTLRERASARGMGSLRDDGMRLAAEGTVSVEEVLRVTRAR